MVKFKPEKLKVTYSDKISCKEFILPRKYTLTHSDETANLFLTIGKEYDFNKVDYTIRDEVLACWEKEEKYYLRLDVQVDNGLDISNTIKRDKIFRQKLPLAIMTIIYGDNLLLENNKELYDAAIIVKFNSKVKEYNTIEQWGKINDYKYETRIDNGQFPKFGINPFPGLPPVQMPKYNKNKKGEVIERALIATLEPYIKSEIYTMFGNNAPYCIKTADILDAKIVNTYGPCSEEYEIVVGLKVGKKAIFYNNLIMTFLINGNRIKIKNVKNPRE